MLSAKQKKLALLISVLGLGAITHVVQSDRAPLYGIDPDVDAHEPKFLTGADDDSQGVSIPILAVEDGFNGSAEKNPPPAELLALGDWPLDTPIGATDLPVMAKNTEDPPISLDVVGNQVQTASQADDSQSVVLAQAEEQTATSGKVVEAAPPQVVTVIPAGEHRPGVAPIDVMLAKGARQEEGKPHEGANVGAATPVAVSLTPPPEIVEQLPSALIARGDDGMADMWSATITSAQTGAVDPAAEVDGAGTKSHPGLLAILTDLAGRSKGGVTPEEPKQPEIGQATALHAEAARPAAGGTVKNDTPADTALLSLASLEGWGYGDVGSTAPDSREQTGVIASASSPDHPISGDAPLPAKRQRPVAILDDHESVKNVLGEERVVLSQVDLDGLRGGFETPTGLQVSFGILQATYINGNLVTMTSMNIADLSKLAGTGQGVTFTGAAANIIQIGNNNVFPTSSLSPNVLGALFIQNSSSNTAIQTRTTITATANSLQVLRDRDFQLSLRQAIIDSRH